MIKGLEYHCHGVGQNTFHLVWKPKYAKNPFKFADVRKNCDRILRKIAEVHNIEMLELYVEADHVHAFVNIPAVMSVSKALQLLKGGSAYKLFRQHLIKDDLRAWLRKHFRKGHFWSPGKFFRSVGNVTADVIQAYINDSHHGWHFPKQTTLVPPACA